MIPEVTHVSSSDGPRKKSPAILRVMSKQLFKDYGYDAYDQFCRTNGPEARHSYIERRQCRAKV